MALQSGESDMSPKAKVSYDQDKFQVEFNVQDYTPEVSPTPELVLRRPLVNIPLLTVMFILALQSCSLMSLV